MESAPPAADQIIMKPLVRRQWTFFSIAFMAFGLLLWARFILVTGHPRTATAVPTVEHAAASAQSRVSSPPTQAQRALKADQAVVTAPTQRE